MNPDTGEIKSEELLTDAERKYWVEVYELDLSGAHRRRLQLTGRTKVGRNERCPCGSGAKFKHCCLTGKEPLAGEEE